ncbi:hypothetical protein BAC1_00715 [uncultured bacterium]|nr:hypothetical protein BAC1_00715 [uncultured bacterium]
MTRIAAIIFVILSFIPSLSFAAGLEEVKGALSIIKDDYRAFYLDGKVMVSLGAGVAAAGLLANSSADREAHEYFQDNLRSGATDSFSDVGRVTGDVLVAIPLLFGTYALSGEGAVKSWAADSMRAFLVGAPAGLFLQYATGASRPEEGSSGWKPFRGNNGLSGHAFTGAVPFITAAKRQEGLAMKSLFYGLSVLPGFSRVNDEKHYLSQVALGWYLAYLSADVIENKGNKSAFRLSPFPEGAGVMLTADF